jgi:hypothetical protein
VVADRGTQYIADSPCEQVCACVVCVCVCGVCVVCVCGVRVWCVCHNEVEKVHTHSKMQTSFSSAVQPKRTTRPFWLSHWARTGQAVSE